MSLKETRDPAETARQLEAWFAKDRPAGTTTSVTDISVPTASGYSNETIFATVTFSDEPEPLRVVVRVEPEGPGLYLEYSVDTQLRVLQALTASTDIPSPSLLGSEDDRSVLGAPFFVMHHVEGRVPGDNPPFTTAGWVTELQDAERSALYDNALQTLAQVHAIDWRAAGLSFLATDGDVLAGQIAHYRKFYEWAAAGTPSPTIEAAFDWIEANRPSEPEPVTLVWGDARMGNMIFADDLSVASVLDWEMAMLGSPEMDLGWWVFFDRYYSDAIGAPHPGGFPTRDAVLARYAELTGHEPRHVDFYEAFAAFRGAIISLRMVSMMIEAGTLPPDSDMATSNPPIQLMAVIMGLPAPSATPAQFMSKTGASQ